jgi:hypothetical protein
MGSKVALDLVKKGIKVEEVCYQVQMFVNMYPASRGKLRC